MTRSEGKARRARRIHAGSVARAFGAGTHAGRRRSDRSYVEPARCSPRAASCSPPKIGCMSAEKMAAPAWVQWPGKRSRALLLLRYFFPRVACDAGPLSLGGGVVGGAAPPA